MKTLCCDSCVYLGARLCVLSVPPRARVAELLACHHWITGIGFVRVKVAGQVWLGASGKGSVGREPTGVYLTVQPSPPIVDLMKCIGTKYRACLKTSVFFRCCHISTITQKKLKLLKYLLFTEEWTSKYRELWLYCNIYFGSQCGEKAQGNVNKEGKWNLHSHSFVRATLLQTAVRLPDRA